MTAGDRPWLSDAGSRLAAGAEARISCLALSVQRLLLAPRRPCPPRRGSGERGTGRGSPSRCQPQWVPQVRPPCHPSSGPWRWTPRGRAPGTSLGRGLPHALASANPPPWSPVLPSPREPRPGLEGSWSPPSFCRSAVPGDNHSFPDLSLRTERTIAKTHWFFRLPNLLSLLGLR